MRRGFLLVAILGTVTSLRAQQVDVPEPTFMQISGVQSYQIRFKGRDPFFNPGAKIQRAQVPILELEFRGVLKTGGGTIAIFNWRGDSHTRYILKQRRLYTVLNDVVDGVTGDIKETEVVLSQGNVKVPFPREQRRP